MNGVQLLALDIDGTLAFRGHEVLPRTREALHRASGEGIEVVIATGRRYRTTRYVIDAVGLDLRCVCLGGALVKQADGETLAEHRYDSERARAVIEILREAGQAAIVQRDSVAGGADFVIDGGPVWNGWTSTYMEGNQQFSDWRRDLPADKIAEALVIGAFATKAELDQAAAEMHRRFPAALATVITPVPAHVGPPGGFYLEVANASACKWKGLRKLAAHLDIAHSKICAVGDEVNDLTMIQGAGFGVAMANGHPDVIDAADHVTGRHDADGVADLIDGILSAR